MYGVSGENSPVFKGYIKQIDPKTNKIIGIYAGAGDAARKTGFKLSGINKVVCGYGKTYKGYKWVREEKA